MEIYVENDIYKEYKKAHYAMWDWIAKQVTQAESTGSGLHITRTYKALWLESNGYSRKEILHDCFACTVCKQNCNECPLNDVLDGCMDVWLEDVCKAFSNNNYDKAYSWAIKIRDGWK